MKLTLPLAAALLCFLLCRIAARGETASAEESAKLYAGVIQPILEKNCYECHSHANGKSKGGLILDHPTGWLKGGDTAPAVVPGEPGKSLLLSAVRHEDKDLRMPKEKLSDDDIAYIERWIALGAPFPPALLTASRRKDPMEAAKTHWAFQPVRAVLPPRSGNIPVADPDSRAAPLPRRADGPHGDRNVAAPWAPIDAFIGEKLAAAGLAPAPPADARTLIRRVTFDLIGLPPTPQEVNAFVEESIRDPQSAIRDLVDRLLASPRYGERWARHWLDLVRFCETNGFNRDWTKPNLWRYRDYVIAAFNDDLPYDEFVREQIAGDLLPPRATTDGKFNARLPATGLWWSSELVYNNDVAEQKADQVDAQLDILGKAFLGLSVSCARCHDHKFDPIPTRDYYALAGIFHSTKGVQRPLALAPLPEDTVIGGDGTIPPNPAVPAAFACAEADDARFNVWQVRVLPQHKDKYSLPNEPQIGDVKVHIRGQAGRYGEVAPRTFLTALPGGDTKIERGSGRLELADWLVNPKNPLTARVMVNRIWQQHFGTGLVETPNDFGIQGTAPSHPELLDWLAARFIAEGWSVKAMHRLMLLSRAYQMSSQPSDAARERDPANKLLSHMPVRRLEAEAVRDSILAVSGSLDPTMFGAGIEPHLTPFMTIRYRPASGPLDGACRRSIYLTVRRNFLNPMLLAFDFPNPSEPNGRRNVSNVPTQALALLNNELVHDQARRWAERELAATGPARERVERMFERALGRAPTDDERDELLSLVATAPDDAQSWADLAHVLFNTKSFIFIR